MAAAKVKLIANDGAIFELDQEVAFQCQMIREMCSNLGVSDSIDVDVTAADGKTLEKIIKYCTDKDLHYKRKKDQRVELSQQHRDYLEVDGEFLCKILTGANFLNIPGLLDITSQYMADLIKGKTVEQIRNIYTLPDDMTPEEKEEIKQRYEWLDI